MRGRGSQSETRGPVIVSMRTRLSPRGGRRVRSSTNSNGPAIYIYKKGFQQGNIAKQEVTDDPFAPLVPQEASDRCRGPCAFVPRARRGEWEVTFCLLRQRGPLKHIYPLSLSLSHFTPLTAPLLTTRATYFPFQTKQ